MCSNYRPVTRADQMLRFFGVAIDEDLPPVDCWPTGTAPFIKLAEDGQKVERVATLGLFGLLPHFAGEVAQGRKTYNARSETVDSKPSFRTSWRKGYRCIIPAEHIYEPNWETGKAVRWAIRIERGIPMGIAGIYWPWKGEDGPVTYTFAMLTVNADGHPVMQRFHRPEDEKRMVVILDPKDYQDWLTCSVADAPRYFRQWTGPLEAEAAPTLPRAPRSKSTKPPPTVPDLGLF
jgi:putative SOS response-associated peptidase YedK